MSSSHQEDNNGSTTSFPTASVHIVLEFFPSSSSDSNRTTTDEIPSSSRRQSNAFSDVFHQMARVFLSQVATMMTTFPDESTTEDAPPPCPYSLHDILQKSQVFHTTSQLSSDECGICLEKYALYSKIFQTPCHHTFHPECFLSSLQHGIRTCPMCRQPLVLTTLFPTRE